MTTTYAVTVNLGTSGVLDEDLVDRLVEALAPSSGSFAHTTEDAAPAVLDIVVDIEAEDPAAAAADGVRVARAALTTAGLPSDGEAIGVRVVRVVDQDRVADSPTVPQLLGLTEVGQLLGVSRQRVSQLRDRADFPEPLAVLASGPVWAGPSLNHFVAGWDRTPGGRRRTPVVVR